MNKLNLTRFFGIIAIIAVAAGSGILLTACGKKPMDRIEYVSGIPESIGVNRDINWNNLIIRVIRTNDKKEEVKYKDNKSAFSVPLKLTTEGVQDVTISYTEKKIKKSVVVSVTVEERPTLNDDEKVSGFSAPELVASHRTVDLANFKLTDETSTAFAEEHEVGDDNAFIFAPEITVMGYGVWDGSLEGLFEYKLQKHNGAAFVDVNADEYFDAVNQTDCSFDFKDDVSKDQRFKLSLTPSAKLKAMMMTPNAGYDFTFTVRDGWNAYSLRDLQLLSNRGYYRYSLDGQLDGLTGTSAADQLEIFADGTDTTKNWSASESATDYFWGSYRTAELDTYLSSMTTITNTDTSTNQYNTLAKFLAKTIKGMYLQCNITILQEHADGNPEKSLPDEFLTDDNRLFRGAALFDHIVPHGGSFTFNGNYFAVDAEDIAIEKTDGTGFSALGYGTLFNFGETQTGTGVESEAFYNAQKVIFKNVSVKNNATRLVNASADADKGYASSLGLGGLTIKPNGNDGALVQRVLFNDTRTPVTFDNENLHALLTGAKVVLRDCKIKQVYSSAIAASGYADIYLYHNEFTEIYAPALTVPSRRDIPTIDAVSRESDEYDFTYATYRDYKQYKDTTNWETKHAHVVEPDDYEQRTYLDMYTLTHGVTDFDTDSSIWLKQMTSALTALGDLEINVILDAVAGQVPGYTIYAAGEKFAIPFFLGRVDGESGSVYNIKNTSRLYVVADNDTANTPLFTMDANAEIVQFFDQMQNGGTKGTDSSYMLLVGSNGTFMTQMNQTNPFDANGFIAGKLLSSLSDTHIIALSQARNQIIGAMVAQSVPAEQAAAAVAAMTDDQVLEFVAVNFDQNQATTSAADGRNVLIALIRENIPEQNGVHPNFIDLATYLGIGGTAEEFYADLRHKTAYNGKDYAYMFLQLKMGDTILDVCLELKAIPQP